jgi:hypothetical protein
MDAGVLHDVAPTIANYIKDVDTLNNFYEAMGITSLVDKQRKTIEILEHTYKANTVAASILARLKVAFNENPSLQQWSDRIAVFDYMFKVILVKPDTMTAYEQLCIKKLNIAVNNHLPMTSYLSSLYVFNAADCFLYKGEELRHEAVVTTAMIEYLYQHVIMRKLFVDTKVLGNLDFSYIDNPEKVLSDMVKNISLMSRVPLWTDSVQNWISQC